MKMEDDESKLILDLLQRKDEEIDELNEENEILLEQLEKALWELEIAKNCVKNGSEMDILPTLDEQLNELEDQVRDLQGQSMDEMEDVSMEDMMKLEEKFQNSGQKNGIDISYDGIDKNGKINKKNAVNLTKNTAKAAQDVEERLKRMLHVNNVLMEQLGAMNGSNDRNFNDLRPPTVQVSIPALV